MDMRKRISWILFLVLLIVVVGCEPESMVEIEKRIAASDRLTRLNAVCESLPKPPTLELRYKRISGNSEVSLLIFYYSKSIPFDEAKRVYMTWLDQNGWAQNLDFSSTHYGYFDKGGIEISISTKDTESLEVGCQESR